MSENIPVPEKTEAELKQDYVELSRINDSLCRELECCAVAQARILHLNDLRENLIKSAGLEDKLKEITDGIISIFEADFARIWLIRPGDRCESCVHARDTEGKDACCTRHLCLHLLASSGRYTHLDGKMHGRVPFGCYKIGRVASGADAKFLTNDVTRDPRVHDHEWARNLGLAAFAGYRLISPESQPVGVLALFTKSALSTEDDMLLEGLAHSTEQIVENARVEEKLRVLNENLEARVKERTLELEESRRAVELINRELDDFTYIISHDLKEPLRSIDAFSKFIMDDYRGVLDEKGKFYFERIRFNVSRMKRLIEDLLEISRVERKKNVFAEVEVKDLVEEVRLRLEYRINEKKARVTAAGDLPRVYCDRVRLTEVLVNLVSNAIKFHDKADPLVEIGVNLKEDYYEFYVKDNGPGIEEKYFEKIFEIFQRLGKREDNEGTGAGLTIARKIVQMHKGRIWVESRVGEGATFYFTIPTKEKYLSELEYKKIGEILIDKKLVNRADLETALEEQKRRGGKEYGG